MRDPVLGTVFNGRFHVRAHLGQGGMAEVYRALDERTGHEVALKLIPPELGDDPEVSARFARETQATALIDHPAVVEVHAFGRSEEGRLFLALELLPGQTLAEVIDERAPLPSAEVVHIGTQIADALTAAHAQRVLHRDLKPSNVVLLPDGRAKVFDFGLARLLDTSGPGLTAADARVGTPLYMPPEYVQGHGQDHRGDLYALGMILYELATGEVPFTGSPYEILFKAVTEPLSPPRERAPMPDWLDEAIVTLLSRDPADRPASAAAAKALLEPARGEG